jgi:putative oxidoreductase
MLAETTSGLPRRSIVEARSANVGQAGVRIARKTVSAWKRIEELQTRIAAEGWALVPLRLLVGYGFAEHGYAKLERGPEHFAAIVAALGIPAPSIVAWATTVLELLGGILLVLGAVVPLLGVPLIAVMATAMIGVHLRYGFSSVRLKDLSESGAQFGPVGFEVNLLYITALVALALSGPSPLSVDRWLRGKGRADVRQAR